MRHSFRVILFTTLPLLLSCGIAQAQYALGAVQTNLIETTKPTSIGEVRRLQNAANTLATMQATTLAPGEIPVITEAQPSNVLLKREVKTKWTARPKGALSAYGGNTGPSGFDLIIEYTSPEVSGKVFSDGSCTGPNGFTCFSGYYYSFTTQVPNLENLGAGTNYALIGSRTEHISNHWGTSSFLAKLRKVADVYYMQYKELSNPKLEINDISLETGGVFDLNQNWIPSHKEHRIGVVGDLRSVPVDRIRTLKEMLRKAGIYGRVLIHVPPDAPHWHVREYDSRE